MPPPIRKTNFVPEWIDMEPRIPVPKIDWITRKSLDVPYGDQSLQKMDIYYPESISEKYPVLILVHGGGFIGCDKRDWHFYPGFHALQRGFVLVSVNYRLAPASPFPAAVDDVKSAVSYLRKKAEDLQLDEGNFFLYGTSAGGNLVSYAGLDGGASKVNDFDYHVNAVAALCPLINFCTWVRQVPWYITILPQIRKMLVGYAGGIPKKTTQSEMPANADSRIADSISPPAFYLQHGSKDWGVPMQQSIDFHKNLLESGKFKDGDLVLDILEGAPHAGAGPEFIEPKNVLPILEFFERHINKKAY